MLDANALHISLALEGVSTDLQVLSFVGREALNQPFRFDIELVSHCPDLELEALLHKPGSLTFGAAGTGIIHGLVYRIEQGDFSKQLTRYSISLVPQLAYLRHSHDQQIFQDLTVPEIIALVLEARGILADAYSFQLGATYPKHDYCVQYDESDLHFIQRLCEEEGIHFHFQHSNSGHKLVFGDDQTVFRKLAAVRYQQDSGMAAEQPVIKRFGLRLETRTTRVSRRDYDFEKPVILPEGSATSAFEPDLEDYDYPGRFTDRARGKQLATRALERHRSDYQLVEGQGDEPTLVSGHFMTLAEHPRSEWNDLWLLLEVIHEGKQPQVLGENITSDVTDNKGDFHQGYRNRFLATPWDAHYRPQLQHLKPKALGSQTAIVTGPPKDEIHCDQYGRVKVQFHWDREGQADDKTSCWVRVASGWAGSAYGGIAIPRIGMEVLVTFLEGDPDQPLITGCLYHKENVVPYDLPANKTRSTFKTLSSPGGKGYNELRIEDKKGAEQIYLHAQRNWDENIEHDQKIRIGNERHDTVEANVYSEFKAEERRITHRERKTEARADDHLTIASSQHVKVGTGQFVEAGNEIHYYAGNKVVIDAGMELTAKGGGSFIKLDPSGVTLSGANIKINSGGAPGKGSGIQILGPVTPEAADADKPGSTLQQALFIPHQLGTSSSAIDTVIQKDLHSLPAGAATAQAIPSPLVQTGSLSFVPAAQSDSGPGKWVTQKIDYDGISNTLTMFTNRLGSLGDEGRVFGSERKDYQHTTRRMIQEWMPLDESEQHLAVNSAINIYGQRREIAQRYLEGDDNWQLSGRSLHWQPVTASTVYEQKDKQQ